MSIIPALTYPGQTTEDGRARDDIHPGDRTGTPLEQAWIRCLIGAQAAVVTAAGVEPTGQIDTPDDSDLQRAVVKLVGQRIGDNAPQYDIRGAVLARSRRTPITRIFGASGDGESIYCQLGTETNRLVQGRLAAPDYVGTAQVLEPPMQRILSASFSSDGRLLNVLGVLSNGDARGIFGYNLRSPWRLASAERNPATDVLVPNDVNAVQFTAGGTIAVTLRTEPIEQVEAHRVSGYRWQAAQEFDVWQPLTATATGLCLAPGDRDAVFFTTASGLGQVTLLFGFEERFPRAVSLLLEPGLSELQGLCWSADGRRLLVARGSGTIHEFELLQVHQFRGRT